MINRRTFLKSTAATAAGFWVAGHGARARGDMPGGAISPSDKLNVAFIGTANQAEYDRNETVASRLVNVVALCDVDDRLLDRAGTMFPRARKYNDFRKMLELKEIDAVVIATPDHTHAVATSAALRLGKHVYCEKPLTHTVHEARVITELAEKYRRVTQMGTQIHASVNYRRVVEIVKAGVLGKISEVHVWCGKGWSATEFPITPDPVPAGLHYDLWVGPAPSHDYNQAYLPVNWRRFMPFGDGTLGDMACHYCDLPFWALDLRQPMTIQAKGPTIAADCWPDSLTVHYEFPSRGELPPVKLTWYDGSSRPEDFTRWPRSARRPSGVMFIGEKGQMFADYDQHFLYPEEAFRDFKPPGHSIPDSAGHHKEWVLACLKNDPSATTCRFSYSGVLSEAVLLGNVAYRAGAKLTWDAAAMTCIGNPDAQQFLHYEYRKGWEL